MNTISSASANQLLDVLLNDTTSTAQANINYLAEYQSLQLESERHHQADWAAHMSPGLAPYSLLGIQLATLHGGNLLSPKLYPTLKQAEQETLNWLQQKFHQPYAHFTHGSSYGNLEALWKARDNAKTSNRVVYASSASHYSVAKACQLLNLDLIILETDSHGRIDIEQLQSRCQKQAPLAIVLNMGTSATGVLDPLHEGLYLSKNYGAWAHVDAAWGGAIMFSDQMAAEYNDLQLADSISFDPHKSLYQPKPSSVLLYQKASTLSNEAVDYLSETPAQILPGSYGGELFLPLWLNWKLLGEDWFATQVWHRTQQAALFSTHLMQKNCPVITSETGIVCFQIPDKKIGSALVKEGIFSEITLADTQFYRAIFASHKTKAETLIKALQDAL